MVRSFVERSRLGARLRAVTSTTWRWAKGRKGGLLRRARRAVAAFFAMSLGFAPACTSEAEHVSETSRAGHALVHQEQIDARKTLLEALEVLSPTVQGDGIDPELHAALSPFDAGDRAAAAAGLRGDEMPAANTRPLGGFASPPPYVCEDFEVRLNKSGKPRYKRLRKTWTPEDKARFKALVEMVADEMGADPRLVRLWALRESTYNPYAIHVLNPDLRGADRSWERHRWTERKEKILRKTMRKHGVKSKAYWEAKADLKRLFRFKDNAYFDAQVEYEVVYRNGTRVKEQGSRWSYGYGPFGFNPTYFLPLWDRDAPPWVFCNSDGIPAIVTAIWAARRAQRECRAQGYGDSYEAVNRRFSSGSCRPRPERAHLFRARARGWGLNPSRKAKLGKQWIESETDRQEIVEHMRARAKAEGLLSAYAQ